MSQIQTVPGAGYVLKSCPSFPVFPMAPHRWRATRAQVDASVAEKQGARFVFDDGSRFVFRLSGTVLRRQSHCTIPGVAHVRLSSPQSAACKIPCVSSRNLPMYTTLAGISPTLRVRPSVYWFHSFCISLLLSPAIGTGSSGATIRMYIEKFVKPDAGEDALNLDTAEVRNF